ncbi:hypothetical protein HNR26_003837 [Rhizobium rosettiformans]|uniref:Uncharacterized protein n=1 Tax=Rhizobium rosettiformans TaxID=1368430 RepID=A0A7W8HUW3_9HYPH|nr:hypothetical protein [Rhizobium rosettiformans]MBB5277748.1 hypothetical protein [Rhizobium rosettiformans]
MNASTEYRICWSRFYRGQLTFLVVVNGNYRLMIHQDTLGL